MEVRPKIEVVNIAIFFNRLLVGRMGVRSNVEVVNIAIFFD